MTSDDAKKAAKDIVGDASEKAAAGRDKASEAAHLAGAQAKDAVARVADVAQDQYGKAKDSVASLSDHIPDAASDTLTAGQRVYARGSEQIARQVAKQPVEALLLAGAIGYLVGWAANRG